MFDLVGYGKKIIIEFEVTNIDSWSTDWDNEEATKQELKELERDLLRAMEDNIGIYKSSVIFNKIELLK